MLPKPVVVQPLGGRKSVTVCVAAICSNRKAIACVADKAVTINQYIQWDADATKIIPIGKPRRVPPCVAMISGEEDFSIDLIAEVERAPDFGTSLRSSMKIAEDAYKKLLESRIVNDVLDPKLLKRADYISLLQGNSVNSTYVQDVAREIQAHRISCCVLFCGFENDNAFIFYVGYPGRSRDCTHSAFETIGSGSEMATTRMLSLEASRSDGVLNALYNAFDGKANAEIITGVGYEWDASILVPWKPQIKVPLPRKKNIESIFAEASASPFHPRFGSDFKKIPRWKRSVVEWVNQATKLSAPRKSKGRR
jgi:hypothetical protein